MNGPTRTVNHLLLALASVVIIAAGLRATTDLLTPVLLAAFITAITHPAITWLEARRVPLWASLSLVLVVAILLGLLLAVMVGLSLQELYQRLPEYEGLLTTRLAGLNDWLAARDIDLAAALEELPLKSGIFGLIQAFVFGALGVLTNLGFTLLLFAFMLISLPWFVERLGRGAGGRELLEQIGEVNVRVIRVMRIRAGLGLAAAVGDMVLLWFIGVPFILLWGFLSFLLSFIPNIGFMLSLIPPAMLALLQIGPEAALLVVVGYILINSFFDEVLAPRLIGQGLGMAPVVTLLAVIFWSFVLGPIGAVLSEPLTLIVQRLVLNRYPDTRPLARLIADDGNGQGGWSR